MTIVTCDECGKKIKSCQDRFDLSFMYLGRGDYKGIENQHRDLCCECTERLLITLGGGIK